MTHQIYSDKKIFLSTKLQFGKYKDKSIFELLNEDLNYVDWLLDKPFADRPIDDRVKERFNQLWEERNYKKYGFRNDNLNK